MEIQKVYVRHDGTTVVKCHNCGTTKTVDAAKLKKRGKPLKLRCSCQAVFQIFFEFRGAYRKKCSLDGYYTKLPVMNEWLKMRIDSISMTGVGFTTLNRDDLRKNDRLMMKIFLDDREKSKIEKRAVVKWVQGRDIGSSFVETDKYDKILGFYLMP
ncbi:hypothetical protein KJ656_02360 [bacterium]|nr:hypothetical protein [bacterium]